MSVPRRTRHRLRRVTEPREALLNALMQQAIQVAATTAAGQATPAQAATTAAAAGQAMPAQAAATLQASAVQAGVKFT